jgi:putative SOS response-associated peptidase YedK
MCGRFVSLATPEALALRFGIDEITVGPQEPRHNVAPSTDVLAILDHDGRRRLGTLSWGYVPSWAPDPRSGPRPINARAETVTTSRLYRDAVRSRRCVVPMDGFYEWHAVADDGPSVRAGKQPYLLTAESSTPFAVAAIRSTWRPPEGQAAEGEALHTVALLTCAATGVAALVHHRMPLLVPDERLDDWLDPDQRDGASVAHLVDELTARPPGLVAHPVSTRVNAVANDDAGLMTPTGPPLESDGPGTSGGAGR